eukprot:g308.t1
MILKLAYTDNFRDMRLRNEIFWALTVAGERNLDVAIDAPPDLHPYSWQASYFYRGARLSHDAFCRSLRMTLISKITSNCGGEMAEKLIRMADFGDILRTAGELGPIQAQTTEREIVEGLIRDALEVAVNAMGDSVPNPLDPSLSLEVAGIGPSVRIIESNTRPIVIPLLLKQDDQISEYRIIVKHEDIRRDQIILNFIRMMQRIVKRELCEQLHMVTYNVLPTSRNSGLIQFVRGAATLDFIESNHGSYKAYLEACAKKRVRDIERGKVANRNGMCFVEYTLERLMELACQEWGSAEEWVNLDAKLKRKYCVKVVLKEIEERFMRSLAGYSVATWLLGVGDRHTKNVMVCEDGRYFHIDYGFVFGKDPKILQPPVRVTANELGVLGDNYERFMSLASRTFNCARHHVNLFVSLLLPLTVPTVPNRCEDLITHEDLTGHLRTRFLPGNGDREAALTFRAKLERDYDGAVLHTGGESINDKFRKVVHGASSALTSIVEFMNPSDDAKDSQSIPSAAVSNGKNDDDDDDEGEWMHLSSSSEL